MTSFAYDAAGRRISQERANGSTTTFAYDPIGRTFQMWHRYIAGNEIDRALYESDAAGRPVRKETLPRTLHQYEGGAETAPELSGPVPGYETPVSICLKCYEETGNAPVLLQWQSASRRTESDAVAVAVAFVSKGAWFAGRFMDAAIPGNRRETIGVSPVTPL